MYLVFAVPVLLLSILLGRRLSENRTRKMGRREAELLSAMHSSHGMSVYSLDSMERCWDFALPERAFLMWAWPLSYLNIQIYPLILSSSVTTASIHGAPFRACSRLQVLWFQYEVTTACYVMTGFEKLVVHAILILIGAVLSHQLCKQVSAISSFFSF